MIITTLNLHQHGDEVKEKSSHIMLLFFALLLLCQGFSEVRAAPQSKGWSIGNTATSEAAENADDTEAELSENTAAETDSPEAENTVEAEPEDSAPELAEAPEEAVEESEVIGDAELTAEDDAAAQSQAIAEAEQVQSSTELVTQPVIDLDPALRDSLDLEFQRILELQETQDAFNEDLGEAYLGYGQALQRAGRLEEARDMFANALHISKINNGVNSIQQRPMLKALFEISFARQNAEDAEEHLKRIIWLEGNHKNIRDDFSFDMVLRLGNLYIDRYLARPTASDTSIANLASAERYLKYAIDRYSDEPMDKLLMPYGELALVNFLKGKTQSEVRTKRVEDRRNLPPSLSRQESINIIEQERVKYAVENSFYQAEEYLIKYLTKAKAEDNNEHVITALLNLADLNLLYGRKIGASQYYELAWMEAQELPVDHPIVVEFSQPTALPAFSYALEREPVEGRLKALFVPLTFNLDDRGRVRGFSEDNTGEPYPDLLKRAMRAAKRMRFRPVIENGKMIGANDYTYDIKVLVRRKQTDKG